MHTGSPDTPDRQAQLIRALLSTLRSAGAVAQYETHISHVLVAGENAFKIKKAVRFDFLDFSTLESRRHFCEEELRLNRRLAPELYLAVLPVTGSVESPHLGGAGPAVEYVLHMRAFGQEALWSERLASGMLAPTEVDQLADRVASFHRDAPVAPAGSRWGTSAQLLACADDILVPLAAMLAGTEYAAQEAALQEWHRKLHSELCPEFERRRREGFVREGHGDLHCGNILTLQDQATAFDCIEFSEELRWIDVLNDLAFAVMDLHVRGCPDLAARLLNRYLEASGDYAGLVVLPYYLALRALVRCKVHVLRLQELAAEAPQRRECEQSLRAYLNFAGACMQRRKTALMITHGFSGSGKSTVAARVVEMSGAIRLRSDVERKRLHGMPPSEHVPAAAAQLYAPVASTATYVRLAELARAVIGAGWPAIVDAAFLDTEQRHSFAALAQELNVPFLIVEVRASEARMRERLARRASEGRDPSDAGIAVLAQQLACYHPLTVEEKRHAVVIDNTQGETDAAVRAALAGLGLCDPA